MYVCSCMFEYMANPTKQTRLASQKVLGKTQAEKKMQNESALGASSVKWSPGR